MKVLSCLALLALGVRLWAAEGLGPVPGKGSMSKAKEHMAAGRWAQAAAEYEACSPQKAGRSEGWRLNNWGLSLIKAERAGEALPVLDKAVAADPKNFTARANLGAAYETLGDRVKAIDVYRRALELLKQENQALGKGKQRDPEAEGPKTATTPAPGDFQEAPSKLKGEVLKKALEVAHRLMDEGKWAEAAAAYAAVGICSPAKREGWRLNNWGLALLRQGQYSDAVMRFLKSVETFPDNPTAWNNLGVAYENLGKSEKAKEAYAHAAQPQQSGKFDQARAELNGLKLDFMAEKRLWEAAR